MGTARRITSNFLSLSISELISKVLQLLVFVYIARIFGSVEFGKFSFGLSFALLVFIFADFGLSTLLVREISRNKKLVNKYVSNSLIIKIFLAILTVIGMYSFLNIFNYPQDTQIITYLLVSFMVVQSFTSVFYSIFRAFEKMHFDALIKILRMFILLPLVFLTTYKGFSLITVTSMFPLTECIILIVTIFITFKKFGKIKPEFQYEFSKKLLKTASLFCLSFVFTGILLYIDVIMLSKIKTSAEVGIYTAASNLVLALAFIPLMYSNAIFPVLSRFFINSKKTLRFAYEKSFKYMLILGLPLSIGTFIFADKIILLFYGPQYKYSIIALRILAGFIGLRFINTISGTLLASINKQRSRVFSQGSAALINIILNFILIPPLGFIGAGIATIVSEFIFFTMYISFIVKYGLKIKFFKIALKPIIASIIMVLIIIRIENLFWGVSIGSIIYFTSLSVIKTFGKDDKDLLQKVITNK